MIRTDSEWFERIRNDSYWFVLIGTDSYWFVLIRTDSHWFVLIRTDSYWFVLIRIDSYWFALIRIDSYRFVLIRIDSYRFVLIRHDSEGFVPIRTDSYWSVLIRTHKCSYPLVSAKRHFCNYVISTNVLGVDTMQNTILQFRFWKGVWGPQFCKNVRCIFSRSLYVKVAHLFSKVRSLSPWARRVCSARSDACVEA